MELFQKAKTVRLRSVKDKYLVAENDRETVSQGRDGSSKESLWLIEIPEQENFVRFRSCYGTYLAATNHQFVPWVAGKNVVQQVPKLMDMSITDWEPMRDGFQVRLRTRSGSFLRPNGGVPPWRNTVTHDIPHRSKTEEKVLWNIDVTEAIHCDDSHCKVIRLQKSTSISSKLKFLKMTPTFRKSPSTSSGFKNPKAPFITLEDLL